MVDSGSLIASHVAEPLTVPMTLAYVASLYAVMPMIIYHVVSFVGPALYRRERQVMHTFVLLATVLFYLGSLIAIELVQPLVISFSKQLLPGDVLFLPNMASYIDFIFSLAFAFGLAFETPVLLLALILLEWINVDQVREKRGWWVVGIFTFAMIATPPDIVSQLCLACPLWCFVEVSLFLGAYLVSKKNTLLEISD